MIRRLRWVGVLALDVLALIVFVGALAKRERTPAFLASWAAWGTLFHLVMGQPPLALGIILILILGAAVFGIFFRRRTE